MPVFSVNSLNGSTAPGRDQKSKGAFVLQGRIERSRRNYTALYEGLKEAPEVYLTFIGVPNSGPHAVVPKTTLCFGVMIDFAEQQNDF